MRVGNSRPNGPACAYTRVESLKIEERPPTATSARQPRTTSGCWRFVTTPSSLFRTVPNPNPTHPIGVVIVPGPGAMPGPVFFCFSRAAAGQPEAGAAASIAPDAGPCPAICSSRGRSVRSKARTRSESTSSTPNGSPPHASSGTTCKRAGELRHLRYEHDARAQLRKTPPRAPAPDRRTGPGRGRAGCRPAPPEAGSPRAGPT